MRRTRPPSFLGPCLTLVLLLAGCGPEERTIELTDVRERAVADPPPPPGITEAERLGFRERSAEPDALPWTWTTPAGWTELPAAPQRVAGWNVAGNPDAEATFSTLSGSGGGLLANVNRWRGQMSLDPVAEADLAALPRETLLGRPAALVDLRGRYVGMRKDKDVADARMLALVAQLPQATAFLRLVGPATVVEAERERFLALAASIRFGASAPGKPPVPPAPPSTPVPPTTPAPPSPAAPTSAGGLRWTTPPGWTAGPSRPMRLASFAAEGAPGSDVSLVIVQGGGERGNLDRWRDQMGLAPLTDADFAALPRSDVLGGSAVFAEMEGAYAGMGGGPGKPGWMLLGMVLVRDAGGVVTVKMVGPADEVRRERDRFRAFAESLRE